MGFSLLGKGVTGREDGEGRNEPCAPGLELGLWYVRAQHSVVKGLWHSGTQEQLQRAVNGRVVSGPICMEVPVGL